MTKSKLIVTFYWKELLNSGFNHSNHLNLSFPMVKTRVQKLSPVKSYDRFTWGGEFYRKGFGRSPKPLFSTARRAGDRFGACYLCFRRGFTMSEYRKTSFSLDFSSKNMIFYLIFWNEPETFAVKFHTIYSRQFYRKGFGPLKIFVLIFIQWPSFLYFLLFLMIWTHLIWLGLDISAGTKNWFDVYSYYYLQKRK